MYPYPRTKDAFLGRAAVVVVVDMESASLGTARRWQSNPIFGCVNVKS